AEKSPPSSTTRPGEGHHPPYGRWGLFQISLLPPLFVQNTDAGFASAHALSALVSNTARKINPLARHISFPVRRRRDLIISNRTPIIASPTEVEHTCAISGPRDRGQGAQQSRQMRSFLSIAWSSGDLPRSFSGTPGGTSFAWVWGCPTGASLAACPSLMSPWPAVCGLPLEDG